MFRVGNNVEQWEKSWGNHQAMDAEFGRYATAIVEGEGAGAAASSDRVRASMAGEFRIWRKLPNVLWPENGMERGRRRL